MFGKVSALSWLRHRGTSEHLCRCVIVISYHEFHGVARTGVGSPTRSTFGSVSSCSRVCRRSQERWIERISHLNSIDLQHTRLKNWSLRMRTPDREFLVFTNRLIPASFRVLLDLSFSTLCDFARLVPDLCDSSISAPKLSNKQIFHQSSPKILKYAMIASKVLMALNESYYTFNRLLIEIATNNSDIRIIDIHYLTFRVWVYTDSRLLVKKPN